MTTHRAATVSTQSLSVPEGGSKTYTVVLKFQPTATVTVDLTLDPANPDLRVSPSPLTFTRSNWSTAKTVTVRADEDLDSVTDPAVAIKHDFQRRRLRRRDGAGRDRDHHGKRRPGHQSVEGNAGSQGGP